MGNTIIDIFSQMEDPRLDRKKLYPLIEIIFLNIAAVVSDSNHFTDIQTFGKANLAWLRKFLPFENGIPSHDAIGYFFSRLDPERFKERFIEWIRTVAQLSKGEIVAIDGKTLCGSTGKAGNKAAIHMISAWATRCKLVLGQRKTEEKSNEITAIPALLDLLELTGCIVTIDAMGCQKEIAARIVGKGADYILTLKENQGTISDEVEEFFQDQQERQWSEYRDSDKVRSFTTAENDHGRVESR